MLFTWQEILNFVCLVGAISVFVAKVSYNDWKYEQKCRMAMRERAKAEFYRGMYEECERARERESEFRMVVEAGERKRPIRKVVGALACDEAQEMIK